MVAYRINPQLARRSRRARSAPTPRRHRTEQQNGHQGRAAPQGANRPNRTASTKDGRAPARGRPTGRVDRAGRASDPLLIANSMSIDLTARSIRRLASSHRRGRRGRFEDSANSGLSPMPGRLAGARGRCACQQRSRHRALRYCHMRRVASKLEWNALATAPMSVTKSPEARDCQSNP